MSAYADAFGRALFHQLRICPVGSGPKSSRPCLFLQRNHDPASVRDLTATAFKPVGVSVLELLRFDQSCRPMAWPRLRQGGTGSAAVSRPRRNELLGEVGRESLPTAWMQPDYSASGVGFSGGGSIPNVLAVMQVIEKLPVDATSATRPSSPMIFSAAT